MALAARQGSQGVVGGLEGAGDAAALRVAARAISRRAFEDTLQMTGLAFGLYVCPKQRIASLNVIKTLAGVLFRRSDCGSEHQRSYYQNSGEAYLNQSHQASHPAPSFVSPGRRYCFPRGKVSTPGSNLRNELVP